MGWGTGSGSNHRTSSTRPEKIINSFFPLSSDGNTKPLPILGTFAANIVSIDTGITSETDFVIVNGDDRGLH